MEKIISYNKRQFWGKVVFSILVGATVLLVFSRFFGAKVRRPLPSVIGVSCVLLLLLTLISLVLTSLYKLPMAVIIDTAAGTLLVSFLFNRNRIIQLTEVQSYAATYVHTTMGDYQGVMLHLFNGEELLFSDFNLADYRPVEAYLKEQGVCFRGQEKFRYIFYYLKNRSERQVSA